MKFIPAKHYTKANRRVIDYIVIHTMELPERPNKAEALARYFQTTNVKVSAHYNIDSKSIVRSVLEKDIAYHAPGANHNGLGFEHAGYMRQTRAEWQDPYSEAMLRLSAELAANVVDRRNIPIQYVNIAGLRAGRRGVTTHRDVSLAFGRSKHMDPGAGFPMNHYLDLVRSYASGGALPPPPHFGEVVQLGSKGPGVEFLQSMLNILRRFHKGAYLAVDGNFGNATHNVVVAFQRFADTMSRMAGGLGLSIDGKVGKKTADAISFWVPQV